MNVNQEVARMTKRYALSESQQTQIRSILLDQKKKMTELFQDSSLLPEDRFRQLRALSAEQVSRIEDVLSPKQRSKYEKDHARAAEEEWPGPDGPPPPPGDEGAGPPPPGV
jgi:hypothetical protein